jgi:hypothetical protein
VHVYSLQSHVCLPLRRGRAERCDFSSVIWVKYSPHVVKGDGTMLSFRDHCRDCNCHPVGEVNDAANEAIPQLVMH